MGSEGKEPMTHRYLHFLPSDLLERLEAIDLVSLAKRR
jgi:hypothetical protein